MTDTDKHMTQLHAMLVELVPQFAAVDPNVVGGVLGQLVALYIAGHNPLIRAGVREAFMAMVDALVENQDTSPNSPWRDGGMVQ